MKKKISLTLDNDFQQYCDLNNIEDPEKLAKQVFNKGFSLLKYGETPNGFKSEPTVIEKEVIKEVIVEVEKIVNVPFEVIKEVIVEVIKEVPVKTKGATQIITKEVPIEVIKEVEIVREIIDTKQIDKLTEENFKLKTELDSLKSSLDSITKKGTLMRGSDMSSLYGE